MGRIWTLIDEPGDGGRRQCIDMIVSRWREGPENALVSRLQNAGKRREVGKLQMSLGNGEKAYTMQKSVGDIMFEELGRSWTLIDEHGDERPRQCIDGIGDKCRKTQMRANKILQRHISQSF